MGKIEQHPDNTRKTPNKFAIGAAILIAIAATVTVVKKCFDEPQRDTSTEQPANTSNDQPEPVHFTVASAKPDAGATDAITKEADGGQPQTDSSIDAGTPLPDDEETALRKACQDLWDSSREETPGKVYAAFEKVAKLLNAESPEDSMYELGELAAACNFRLEQLIGVLKTALAQGDSRVARFVNELVQQKCLWQKHQMQEAAANRRRGDSTDCSTSPLNSPEEQCESDINKQMLTECTPKTGDAQAECVDEFQDRKNDDCEGLSEVSPRLECLAQARERQQAATAEDEKTVKTCVDREAAEFGIDGSRLKELDATARASNLAALRLALLDPKTPPSQQDVLDYFMALRPVITNPDDSEFFRKLGVMDYRGFEQAYMTEVEAAIKQNHKDRYPDIQLKFQLVRTLRDTIQ